MQLPFDVRAAIEERAEALGFAALKRAAAELSDAYRDRQTTAGARLPESERVAAYLVTRMPATYAASSAVLKEVERRSGASFRSVLDVGAGTGAAALAAREIFNPERITALEADTALAGAGRAWLPGTEWIEGDVRGASFPEHELVIASYSLGELGDAGAMSAARRMWRAATSVLVIVEAGTPRGFALVAKLREALLAEGARMLAPCPHEGACPIRAGDWCHFAERVERSSLHRRVKGGELGYEDEKFSYVAVSKVPGSTAASRIVRRPRHEPGLVTLEVCAGAEIRTERVTRRDRGAFRAARHASWGGEWARPG